MRARSFLAALPSLLLLLAAALPAAAQSDDEFLQPEDAFKYTLSADENTVTIEWNATKGYYLYKKRFGIEAATAGIKVGEPVYPKGEIHKDEYFGEQEVYRGKFTVTAPLTGAKAGDTVAFKLKCRAARTRACVIRRASGMPRPRSLRVARPRPSPSTRCSIANRQR